MFRRPNSSEKNAGASSSDTTWMMRASMYQTTCRDSYKTISWQMQKPYPQFLIAATSVNSHQAFLCLRTIYSYHRLFFLSLALWTSDTGEEKDAISVYTISAAFRFIPYLGQSSREALRPHIDLCLIIGNKLEAAPRCYYRRWWCDEITPSLLSLIPAGWGDEPTSQK